MSILDRTPAISHVDDRLRTTTICLGVDYGSRDDPTGQGGLAHLWEHLLMSAPEPSGVSFCEYVERLGGHANAETGLERMLFYAQVHADDADDVTARLLRAVEQPAVTTDRLESERAVVLQELAAAEADPADVVQDAFLATIFAGHPLGRPVGGTVDEVRALSLDQVLDTHAEGFGRRPTLLVVVGPHTPAPLAAAGLDTVTTSPADPAAGRARPGTTRPPVRTTRVPVPLAAPGRSPVRWPDEFAWVCVGGRSPAIGEPGREAYPVLAQLLGASPSSLLYRRLRTELGLAYSFQAWDRGYTEAGAWRVMLGTEPDTGDHAVSTVIDLLKEIATSGPLPDDLDAARRQARMRVVLDLETPLEHARAVAQRIHSRIGDSIEAELAAYERVDGAQVQAAATAILDSLVTVVRPEGSA